MPACYAHYRFGKDVLPTLPGDVRQCIQRFRRMYDMGLQGPDIFFYYYNPLSKQSGNQIGGNFHRQTGREFFLHACSRADSEAARAYLYGLLAHYCLDSLCHPFINRMVSIGEAEHTPLESEFERYLMQKDGLPEPHTQDRSSRIRLTRGECMTVAEFYPGVTGAQVSGSIRGMSIALKFLANPNRERTERILKKLRAGLSEHLIPTEPVEDYAFMTGELQELYDQAAHRYPVLLEDLLRHLKNGEALPEHFDRTFG